MRNNKIYKILCLLLICTLSLSGCNKNDKQEKTEPEKSSEEISIKDNTYSDNLTQYLELVNKNEELQKDLENNNSLLNNKLDEFYNSLSLNDSNKSIREALDNNHLKFTANVTLKQINDDTDKLIDMTGNKGIIVYTSLNDVEKPEKYESKIEELKPDYKIDTKNTIEYNINLNIYNSYVILVMDSNNVLVGKYNHIGNFTINNDSYDCKDIYEKVETTKTAINQVNEKQKVYETYFNDILNTIYTDIKNINKLNSLSNVKIDEMSTTDLKDINDRFNVKDTKGYNIYIISKDNSDTNTKYYNLYCSCIFDKAGDIFYKSLTTQDLFVEDCKKIKKLDDYTLDQIYENIDSLNASIDDIDSKQLNLILSVDNNISLLKTNISFSENYNDVITELDKSYLKYEKDFNNNEVITYRDKDNIEQELESNNTYKFIKIYGGSTNLYYLFENDLLIGFYSDEYIDTPDITEYKNLKLVLTTLDEYTELINSYKTNLKSFENLLIQRVDNYIPKIGYSINHTSNQVYQYSEIVKNLIKNEIYYKELVNSGDNLKYIALYSDKECLTEVYKIYFNSNQEVELIQNSNN